MAKPKRDPWAEFADPVEEPPAEPQTAPPQPANDEFSQIAESAAVVDTSHTEQGFADTMPDETATRLSPEDEAQYVKILSEAPIDEAASQARRFLASKNLIAGSSSDPKKYADSIDETVAYRRQHGVVNKAIDYQKPQVIPDDGAGGAALRGFGDVGTSGLLDEAGAVIDTLGGTPGRQNLENSDMGFGDLYNRNLDINRGIVEHDEKEHPYARISGQLLGGLAIPLGYEGVGLSAGREAMVAARASGMAPKEALAVGRRAAAASVRNAMARDGAIIGGAHGVGSGEGVEGRLGEGALEAGLGAAGGAAVGAVGEAVAPRIAASRSAARAVPETEEQQLIKAADRANIDVLPADVGGPVTRRASSWTAQTMVGGRPIINASEKMQGQAKAERDRIAASIGEALQPEAAGQQAIAGAQKYIGESAREARKFYGSAESASEGLKVPTPKAITALQEQIDALKETPGGAPGLSTLQGLHDALLDGRASVAGIRRMRTVLRDQFLKDGLVGSDLERRVNMVVDAAAEDVRDGLSAAGKPDAAANFAAGDAAWKTRARNIETVIKPLIGTRENPKSGEQVIKTLTADLQGNNARAVKFLKSLPESEQNNVRASIIGAMGKAKAGKQGSEGQEFSLDTFLTNWNQVGESAKNAYFGPEARSALNDLAKIAEGTREAQGYRNMSNTGGVVAGIATAATSLGGIPLLLKTLGTQYALGRLLASPRFARWLARAPKTSLSKEAYLDRLSRIAKAEPAIAGDVLALQQRLTEAFSSAPMKAAASDSEDSEQTPQ